MYRSRINTLFNSCYKMFKKYKRPAYFFSVFIIFIFSVSVGFYYYFNVFDKIEFTEPSTIREVLNNPLVLSVALTLVLVTLLNFILILPFSMPKRIKFDVFELEIHNELMEKNKSLKQRVWFISGLLEGYERVLLEIYTEYDENRESLLYDNLLQEKILENLLQTYDGYLKDSFDELATETFIYREEQLREEPEVKRMFQFLIRKQERTPNSSNLSRGKLIEEDLISNTVYKNKTLTGHNYIIGIYNDRINDENIIFGIKANRAIDFDNYDLEAMVTLITMTGMLFDTIMIESVTNIISNGN